jgi:hypothetical protein
MAPLEELATDPPIAPAGVLLRQPQDQVAAGGRERAPPRPAASAEHGPLATDQLAVPAQKRRRSDRERVPAGSG